MKLRTKLSAYLLLFACFLSTSGTEAQSLTHVAGVHAIGVRGGIGTKDKYGFGVSYNYYFNPKISLSIEVDHEEAEFGNSDFTNVVLVSPGVDYSAFNPAEWCYFTFNIAASVGYDKWYCDLVQSTVKGFVFGANAGAAWEAYPWPFLSCVIKAQQYLLFGNDDQYAKPFFSLGIRYNFHK